MARWFLLLAALFSSVATASVPRVSGVWESNPPAAALLAVDGVTPPELAHFHPTLDLAAGGEPVEHFRLFEPRATTLVEAGERESFHPLQGVELVDTESRRGPPVSYPETRVWVIEVLGTTFVGEATGLSVELRPACGRFSCGVVSDDGKDPLGLASPETLSRAASGLQALQGCTEVAGGAAFTVGTGGAGALAGGGLLVMHGGPNCLLGMKGVFTGRYEESPITIALRDRYHALLKQHGVPITSEVEKKVNEDVSNIEGAAVTLAAGVAATSPRQGATALRTDGPQMARLPASQVGTYTTTIKWGIQEVEARPAGPGFWGKRTPQTNPRVDAYELKVNANNESYYLPHPKGGFVQFENMIGGAVEDGKLIMKPRSIYHVNDLPPFARQRVLQEATRQVEAASAQGLRVEWLVSDPEAATQLGDFFKAEKVNVGVKRLPE